MPKHSAGLLLYRRKESELEVFLVHPGGPLWAKKDLGAWSIPKGEISEGEDPLAAARREFQEETGSAIDGEFVALGTVRQAGGKLVSAWAVAGDCDPARLTSNRFEMEWPPRSGRIAEFPEVDRGAWFTLREARERILASQRAILDQIQEMLKLQARV
jgi:predicted NUDIX family NTP pyrophosphohydrolase